MRLFGNFYARVLVWARDPRAVYYLCGLSFVEAFIFPIMPEVMLAPMMLGKRHKAFFYANISLLFSLLGSLVGYALGRSLMLTDRPLVESMTAGLAKSDDRFSVAVLAITKSRQFQSRRND